MMDWTSNWLS